MAPGALAYLPLVEGVHEPIVVAVADAHSERAIREALCAHAADPRYLANMARPDSIRHALDGSPVKPVTPEHREHAAVHAAPKVERSHRWLDRQNAK